MITSLTEMLELPNFGHMTALTLQCESRFVSEDTDRNYDVINFFSKNLFLRRAGAAIFANFIKILITFIKAIFKDSRKVKDKQKLCIKMEPISVFLDIAKFVGFR